MEPLLPLSRETFRSFRLIISALGLCILGVLEYTSGTINTFIGLSAIVALFAFYISLINHLKSQEEIRSYYMKKLNKEKSMYFLTLVFLWIFLIAVNSVMLPIPLTWLLIGSAYCYTLIELWRSVYVLPSSSALINIGRSIFFVAFHSSLYLATVFIAIKLPFSPALSSYLALIAIGISREIIFRIHNSLI